MIIYVDLVFFINFMYDFLLLITTKIILKRKTKLYRLILGALVGGISIFLLFFNISSFCLFLFKIIISILMIIISFGFKSFYKNFLYLYFISILLGGFMYFLNTNFSYKNTGLIFFYNGFSINIIFIFIISPIILYFYIKQNRELKIINNYYYNVSIVYKNKIYNYRAYLDTGNKLYDPYFHKPIIILYDKKFPKIDKSLLVPYNTVSSSSILECVKVDKIIIDDNKIINKPLVAITKEPLKIDVEVLLHKDYLE